MNAKDIEPLMTISDVATYLNCGEKTVRRMISRGELKAFRYGSRRAIRIHPRDVSRTLKPIPAYGRDF